MRRVVDLLSCRAGGIVHDFIDPPGSVKVVAYHAAGRIANRGQAAGYTYNLAGGLTSIRYPSGRVVSYNFDGAGRINEVVNYTSSTAGQKIDYAPHGAIRVMTLANGLTETTTFNNRLQVQAITVAAASSPLLTLGYAYCPNGGLTCATNNGNLQQQTIAANGTVWSVTQNFSYDALNRLKTAQEETSNWQQTYVFDPYGNRAVLAV